MGSCSRRERPSDFCNCFIADRASKQDLGEFSAELGTLTSTIPFLPTIKAAEVEKTIEAYVVIW